MQQRKSGNGLHLGLSLTECDTKLPFIHVTHHIATSSPPSTAPLDKDVLQRWGEITLKDMIDISIHGNYSVSTMSELPLFFSWGWIGNMSPCCSISNQLVVHYESQLSAFSTNPPHVLSSDAWPCLEKPAWWKCMSKDTLNKKLLQEIQVTSIKCRSVRLHLSAVVLYAIPPAYTSQAAAALLTFISFWYHISHQ